MVASVFEKPLTREAAEERVYRDALRSFVGDCTPDELKGYVSSAFATLWTEQTRVTTFIPVLAMREVRAMLVADHHPTTERVSV